MLKLSLPTEANFYSDLVEDPHVVRVVALSGGYSQTEANERLARNHGVIASLSRALTEGMTANQTDDESTRCCPNPFRTFMKPPTNKGQPKNDPELD